MNTELGWLSLLPSLLAILVAIVTRRVIWALLGGVIFAHGLLFMPSWGEVGLSAGKSLLDSLFHPGNLMIWGFTLAIGALFGVLEHGGTFRSFVQALENKQWVHSRKRARLFTWVLGVVVFIESNVSIMTSGATSRPVYDRLGISREKLAYIIDSTCAPVCILIPLNAWGAFNLGLISQQDVSNPLFVLATSVLLNAYAIFALFLALWVAWSGWSFGPMKRFELAAQSKQVERQQNVPEHTEPVNRKALVTVLLSLVSMVLFVPALLLYTGEGNIVRGNGMFSVFVAIYAALALAIIGTLVAIPGSYKRVFQGVVRGAWQILPLAIILWLAITLGDVTGVLGTGNYLAGLLNSSVPLSFIPALVFLLSATTAFAIGSSWGTFALMIPLAIPLAVGIDLPIPLLIGAALAGGIFGDHASPISDTTIMASLASGSDHIDHVRSQLPYALLAAAMTTGFYLLAGWYVS